MSGIDRPELDGALPAWLRAAAPDREVDYLGDVLAVTARTRQRSAWTSVDRWLPVTFTDRTRAVARPAWLLLVLLMLLAVVAGAIAVGSWPRVPEPFGLARNGLVAFDTGDRIWLMNADGSDRRLISDGSAVDTWPWWSPDGTRLAFWRALPTGRWAIVIVDAKGTTEAIVATRAPVAARTPEDAVWLGFAHGAPSRLSWSPDSRLIAFAEPTHGLPGIWTVRADGTGLVQLGDPGFPADDPTWSSDGTRIAFHGGSEVAGENGLYVMRADGTGVRKISHVGGAQSSFVGPAWQPGGNLIAFQVDIGNSVYHIFTVRSDGTGETDVSARVPSEFVDDGWVTWSPDGSRLLFLRFTARSEATGLDQIVVVDADGSHPVFPATAVATDRIQWSPDGKRVSALHWDAEKNIVDSIVSIDVSGRSPPVTVPITDTSGGASWQRLAP